MTGLADPMDPDEFRRQFPDLASLTAAVPMSTFLDAMSAGREVMASYVNRTADLRPEDGQTTTGLVGVVVDEVLEAVYCWVLGARAGSDAR